MSNPLIRLYAKEHPGDAYDDTRDVNEWAWEEIMRLRSDLALTRSHLDSAVISRKQMNSNLIDCQITVGQMSSSVKRYEDYFSGRELPPNIDIDTAIKARDEALDKVGRLQSIINVFCGNVREELL